MTELGLFLIFDVQNRGWGQGWGQNRGQFWLENINIYFYAKFQDPNLINDWARTISSFWPPKERLRLRLKSKSSSVWAREHQILILCKISRSYFKNWLSYAYFNFLTSKIYLHLKFEGPTLKINWVRTIFNFWPSKKRLRSKSWSVRVREHQYLLLCKISRF